LIAFFLKQKPNKEKEREAKDSLKEAELNQKNHMIMD